MVNSKSKIKENNSTIRFKFATTNSKSKDLISFKTYIYYEIDLIISYIENGGENEWRKFHEKISIYRVWKTIIFRI